MNDQAMRAFLLAAALAAAMPASAQIDADQGQAAPGRPAAGDAPSCSGGSVPASGVLCGSIAACERYCACACRLVKTSFDQWSYGTKDDGATVCDGMPRSGPGMMAASDAALRTVPARGLTTLRVEGAPRATQAVLNGLLALDRRLRNSSDRAARGYTALVRNCHREHYAESVRECGYVLKGRLKLDEHAGDKEKAKIWKDWQSPLRWGMAWPGMNPHSGGYACDIVLVDREGKKCFGYKTGDGPSCSIPEREAAELLVDLVAGAGGRRLTYELWHFQWGGPEAATCNSAAACPWPATGKP